MNSARLRHGLGPVPNKEDLIRDILNEKPPEMARPLGDAYSEYYLKKKGVIPEDYYLEEGWDKVSKTARRAKRGANATSCKHDNYARNDTRSSLY